MATRKPKFTVLLDAKNNAQNGRPGCEYTVLTTSMKVGSLGRAHHSLKRIGAQRVKHDGGRNVAEVWETPPESVAEQRSIRQARQRSKFPAGIGDPGKGL